MLQQFIQGLLRGIGNAGSFPAEFFDLCAQVSKFLLHCHGGHGTAKPGKAGSRGQVSLNIQSVTGIQNQWLGWLPAHLLIYTKHNQQGLLREFLVGMHLYKSNFISLYAYDKCIIPKVYTVKGKLPLPPATTIVRQSNQMHQSINIHQSTSTKQGDSNWDRWCQCSQGAQPQFGEFLPQCLASFASLRKAL